jgi:hypothetical protein
LRNLSGVKTDDALWVVRRRDELVKLMQEYQELSPVVLGTLLSKPNTSKKRVRKVINEVS